MAALPVVSTTPHGEGPHNAVSLADALALRAEHVEVFLTVHVGTIHHLAAAVARADKAVSF
jgi:sulfur relay (sulfurtransferase) complex TusBCD TusD component (DsrE family)